MQHDIWKITLVLGLSLALGFSIAYPLEVLLLATLAIVIWQMLRLDALYQWIRNPNLFPSPETHGQVHLLHREFNRRIKAHRQRKRKLKRYLNEFRKGVSVLPDAIVLIDPQGKIQWANSNAADLLGIQWPRDRNIRFTDLIRDPEVAELLANTVHAGIDSKHRQQAIEIRPRRNPHQTISISLIPYTEKSRMVLARDISRLVKINRMHADFVANVSHELKTPLTVLRGYLELLADLCTKDGGELSGKFAKPLAQMSAQSERMQLIVTDLLYLSKLEDNEHPSAPLAVDVANLIDTILESLNQKLSAKQLKLDLSIDPQLQLLGNQDQLHSAFTNIIDNAVNYTEANGSISIRWKKLNGGAALEVNDNGPGIPESHIPRLTERFYRIDDDRSRESGGTGLGLAIVKHVLQNHDAALEIDSEVGVGSTFRCVFSEARVIQPSPDSKGTESA